MSNVKFGLQVELKGDQLVIRGVDGMSSSVSNLEGEVSRSSKTSVAAAQTNRELASSYTTLASQAKVVSGVLAAMGAYQIGRNAITSMADFEYTIAGVKAVTGATSDELEEMKAVAAELGSTTKFSASQAAEGMRFLGMAGFETNEIILAMPAALNLAAAAGLDLGAAADITSNIMSAFNVEASRTTEIADALATTAASANTDISQMGEAMKFVGPVAAALDISMQDSAAAIGALSNAGIQGGSAGTGLRRVLSSLANPTKEATTLLTSMGLSIDELNPKTHSITDVVTKLKNANLSAADALTIFGDRGGPAILALTEQIPQLESLTQKINDSEGAAKRMADTLSDNLTGDWLEFLSSVEGVFLAIGDAGALEMLRGRTQNATSVVRYLGENLDTLGDTAIILAGLIGGKLAGALVSAAAAAHAKDVANLKLVTSELALAKSAHHRAVQDQLAAQRSLAVASTFDLRAAAGTRLAAANMRLVTTQASLNAATAAYAGVATVAGAAARGLNVALGFIGGPIGLATLAAVGIYTLQDNLGLVSAPAELATSNINKLSKSLEGLGEAQLEQTIASMTAKLMELQDASAEADRKAQESLSNQSTIDRLNPWNDTIDAIKDATSATSEVTDQMKRLKVVEQALFDLRNKNKDKPVGGVDGGSAGEIDSAAEALIKKTKILAQENSLLALGYSLEDAKFIAAFAHADTLTQALMRQQREQKAIIDLHKEEADALQTLADFNDEALQRQVELQQQKARLYDDAQVQVDLLQRELVAMQGGEAALQAFNRAKAIENAMRSESAKDLLPEEAARYRDLIGQQFDLQAQVDVLTAQAEPYAEAWRAATERIDAAFADAWKGAFDSFNDFADALENAFKQLLAELAHAAITKPIVVEITGQLSGSGSITNLLGGLFGGSSSGGSEYGGMAGGGASVLSSSGSSATGSAAGASAGMYAAAAYVGWELGQAIGDAIKGSGDQFYAAGYNLGVQAGELVGNGFEQWKNDGGILKSTKTKTTITGIPGTISTAFESQTEAIKTAFERLGITVADNAGEGITIATQRLSNRKKTDEEFQAAVEQWFLQYSNALAREIGQGTWFENAGWVDLGSEAKSLADALESYNRVMQLTGGTLQEVSVDGAVAARALIALAGGIENLNAVSQAAYQFDTALGIEDGLDPLRTALSDVGLELVNVEGAALAGKAGLASMFSYLSDAERASLAPFTSQILSFAEAADAAAEESKQVAAAQRLAASTAENAARKAVQAARIQRDLEDHRRHSGDVLAAFLNQNQTTFESLAAASHIANTGTSQLVFRLGGYIDVASRVSQITATLGGDYESLTGSMLIYRREQIDYAQVATSAMQVTHGLVNAVTEYALNLQRNTDIIVTASQALSNAINIANTPTVRGHSGAADIQSIAGMMADAIREAFVDDTKIIIPEFVSSLDGGAAQSSAMALERGDFASLEAFVYTTGQSLLAMQRRIDEHNNVITSRGMTGIDFDAEEIIQQAIDYVTGAAEAELTAERDRIAQEAYGLDTQWLELMGDEVALRERALALIDPANQARQQEIWALEDAQEAAEAAAQAEAELAAERDRIAQEAYGLDTRWLELMGDEVALRERALALIDPANQARQEEVWALEDAQAAAEAAAQAEAELAAERDRIAQEAYGLDTRWLELMGDEVALRERALALIDPANQARQEEVWALEDAQEAAEAAAQAEAELTAERDRIAQEAYGLDTRWLELMGDEVSLRERALALIDPANQARQEEIWALEDAQEAAEAAAQAEADRASQRQSLEEQRLALLGDEAALLALRRAEIDDSNLALFDEVEALKAAQAANDDYVNSLQKVTSAADGLRDFADDLAGSVVSGGTVSLGLLQRRLQQEYQAVLGGDLDRVGDFQDVGRQIVQLAGLTATSNVEYQSLIADVVNSSRNLADQLDADPALDIANEQLHVLEAIRDALAPPTTYSAATAPTNVSSGAALPSQLTAALQSMATRQEQVLEHMAAINRLLARVERNNGAFSVEAVNDITNPVLTQEVS